MDLAANKLALARLTSLPASFESRPDSDNLLNECCKSFNACGASLGNSPDTSRPLLVITSPITFLALLIWALSLKLSTSKA